MWRFDPIHNWIKSLFCTLRFKMVHSHVVDYTNYSISFSKNAHWQIYGWYFCSFSRPFNHRILGLNLDKDHLLLPFSCPVLKAENHKIIWKRKKEYCRNSNRLGDTKDNVSTWCSPGRSWKSPVLFDLFCNQNFCLKVFISRCFSPDWFRTIYKTSGPWQPQDDGKQDEAWRLVRETGDKFGSFPG